MERKVLWKSKFSARSRGRASGRSPASPDTHVTQSGSCSAHRRNLATNNEKSSQGNSTRSRDSSKSAPMQRYPTGCRHPCSHGRSRVLDTMALCDLCNFTWQRSTPRKSPRLWFGSRRNQGSRCRPIGVNCAKAKTPCTPL